MSQPSFEELDHLAKIVKDNLVLQHLWTDVTVYSQDESGQFDRPLILGHPPTKLYVHPEDVLNSTDASNTTNVESEWVVPTLLSESWGIQDFAKVFNRHGLDRTIKGRELKKPAMSLVNSISHNPESIKSRPKRLLLAIISDDSTVCYYVVHDGIVKPRQN
jgi:tRNA-splicing endonuclease subunit Sen15